jgi:hypothetical protein
MARWLAPLAYLLANRANRFDDIFFGFSEDDDVHLSGFARRMIEAMALIAVAAGNAPKPFSICHTCRADRSTKQPCGLAREPPIIACRPALRSCFDARSSSTSRYSAQDKLP